MNIRPFQPDDQNAVILLWRECGLVMPQNNPEKDIARKLQLGADLFLVGFDDDRLIATVMGGYEGHRGWINYLAVKPSQQRRGFGEEMMRAIEIRLKQKGCPKINLQVRGNNNAVLAFYTALGYRDDNVVGLGKRLEIDSD